MRPSRLSVFVAASLILIAGAIYLLFPSSLFKGVVKFFNPTASLAAYGVDLQQTSVSGVSSGAAMAVQIHVAHSSIMRGVGVIAGVGYDCVDSRQPLGLRVARGLNCADGSAPYGGSDGADFSVARTTDAVTVPGAIDDPAANLPRQKVWLFSGYNDGEVRRGAMDAVAQYYGHYIDAANIFYKTNNHAPHALVTANYGGPCLALNSDFINNCGYDAAGQLLEYIYGHLNAPVSAIQSGQVLAFDQNEFVPGHDAGAAGFADTGYVYVPTACTSQTCRVHVVFHGSQQYAGNVGDAVYRHGGYNEWAETNRIIVLYPQTQASTIPLNPKGCFDWWGLNEPLGNAQFARKTGSQIAAVKAMLDRLAQNYVASAGSGTFGTPQDFDTSERPPASPAKSKLPPRAGTLPRQALEKAQNVLRRTIDRISDIRPGSRPGVLSGRLHNCKSDRVASRQIQRCIPRDGRVCLRRRVSTADYRPPRSEGGQGRGTVPFERVLRE